MKITWVCHMLVKIHILNIWRLMFCNEFVICQGESVRFLDLTPVDVGGCGKVLENEKSQKSMLTIKTHMLK